MEKEVKNQLPFLDVLVSANENGFITSLFRKKTYTGLLTNFSSFTPFRYKIGLIKTLIDRTFKINSSWSSFHNDIIKVKTTLQKNEFPPSLIDKCIKSHVNKYFKHDDSSPSETNEVEKASPRYYKLPYIGMFSSTTEKKLFTIIKRYCKADVIIKLVFTPLKISTYFSTKDIVPFALKSNLIYEFVCKGCNASYIGETTRHLSVRMKEHLKSDKQSHIYKHLQSKEICKSKCDENCFSILDTASTKFSLQIKEGMHIEWKKPTLNKQVHCLRTSICV